MGCFGSKESAEEEKGQVNILPKQRECTDIFFIALYITAIVLAFGLGIAYIPQKDLQVLSVNHSHELFHSCEVENIKENKTAIGGCFAFALILSYGLVFLMRLLSKLIILVLAGVVTAAIVGGNIWIWVKYYQVSNSHNLVIGISLIIALIIWSVFAVLAYEKVALVLMLYGESSRVIAQIPQIILVGIFVFVVKIILFILILIYVCVLAVVVFNDNKEDYDFTHPYHIEFKDKGKGAAFGLGLFVFIWSYYFFSSCRTFLVAYASAAWYFERDKSDLHLPVLKGTVILFQYHSGTVAFGSFIMAILVILRILLELMKRAQKDKWFLKLCFCIAQMLVTCCITIWTFMSSNAYNITAIQGFNFCRAARRALNLVNLGESLMIFLMTDVIRVVCTLLVISTSILVSINLVNDSQFSVSWPTYLVCLIISYLTPATILYIYKDITNAIYTCLTIDMEQNDGHAKPYYMSDVLQEYVEKVKNR